MYLATVLYSDGLSLIFTNVDDVNIFAFPKI